MSLKSDDALAVLRNHLGKDATDEGDLALQLAIVECAEQALTDLHRIANALEKMSSAIGYYAGDTVPHVRMRQL